MPLTATQTGVDNQNQDVQAENPRTSEVNDIAARVREQRDQEMRDNGMTPIDTTGSEEKKPDEVDPDSKKIVDADTADEQVDTEQTTGKTEAELQAETEAEAAETASQAQAEELVKIKVDGVEQMVPREKIVEAGIRALQKESTADKRLEEATRLLRDAQTAVTPQTTQQQEQQTGLSRWDDETLKYAMAYGTEEQKAEATRQILERQQKQPTPEAIAQSVSAQVLDKLDFTQSFEWFQSEYKDIAKDPHLMLLAANKEQELRVSGDTRSRREVYKEIGDGIRKWKGGSAAVTPSNMEQKRERKAEVVTLPAASVRQPAAAKEQTKTPSQIISDMAKRRGQPA